MPKLTIETHPNKCCATLHSDESIGQNVLDFINGFDYVMSCQYDNTIYSSTKNKYSVRFVVANELFDVVKVFNDVKQQFNFK